MGDHYHLLEHYTLECGCGLCVLLLYRGVPRIIYNIIVISKARNCKKGDVKKRFTSWLTKSDIVYCKESYYIHPSTIYIQSPEHKQAALALN